MNATAPIAVIAVFLGVGLNREVPAPYQQAPRPFSLPIENPQIRATT
jgi:hypothetical protein